MGDMSLFGENSDKSVNTPKKEIHDEKETVVIIEKPECEEIKMHHHSIGNPDAVNIDVDGMGHGYDYGSCGGGFGAGLVGGLIGGGLIGNRGFGAYGAGYGFPYSQNNVSTGDMLSALESVKAQGRTTRDIFAAQMHLSQQQMAGDFATLQKINDSDKQNMAQFVSVSKDICDTKTVLGAAILESRHENAMEHCKTREMVLLGNQRILDKICEAEKDALRDELCELRAQRRTDAAIAVNTQIINSLGSVNAALAGLANQVNGLETALPTA